MFLLVAWLLGGIFTIAAVAQIFLLSFLGMDISSGTEDTLVTIVTGLLLLILSALTIFFIAMLKLGHQWLQKKISTIDAALVPFGQTSTGQYLHGVTEGLVELVDQPTDTLIIQAANLLHKTLPDTQGLITKEQMSEAATTVLEGLTKLLDGVHQSE
jgi:hypothetical protein